MREEIQALDLEIENLKQQRKNTERHIAVTSLPEEDRFTRGARRRSGGQAAGRRASR